MNLIVVLPFGPYARGHRISDSQAIELVLLGENAGNVRKVPDEADTAAPDPALLVDTPADAPVDTSSEPAA